MLLALCTGSFNQEIQKGKIDLFDIFYIAVKYGFDAIEVREDHVADKQNDLHKLGILAQEHRIELIYAYMNWPIQRDFEVMKSNLTQIIQRMDEASTLKAKFMKTGFGPVDDPCEFTQTHLEVLLQIAKEAETRGIILCLENSDKAFGSNPTTIMNIVKQVKSPCIRITYDGGNFAIAGKDPIEALEIMKEYIAYVHLKDVKTGQHVNTYMGDGNIQYPEIFKILQSAGYCGYYCFEFTMDVEKLEEIEKSIAHMEEIRI